MASALLSSRSNSGPSAAPPTIVAEDANRNKNSIIWFVLGLIFTAPTRFFRPFQQKVDPAFDIGVAIVREMQLRDMPEAQPEGQFVAQKAGGMLEGRQGVSLLPVGAPDDDFDGGVFAIGADMDVDDFDGQEARIGGFKANQLREFLSYRFGNA